MNLYRTERQQKEIELVEKHEFVSVKYLAEFFNVDAMTIRRDLDELAKNNSIERIHGGVIKVTEKDIPGLLPSRISFNVNEKKRIAEEALKEIHPGDNILIGGGSTTFWISKFLSKTFNSGNLKVTTISIYSGLQLSRNSNIEINIPSGYLRKKEAVVISEPEKNKVFDSVILSIKGIHPDIGLTSEDFEVIDKKFIQEQKKVIVVADHTKFGLVAVNKIFDFDDIDLIITNKKINPKFVEQISKKVELRIV